MSADRVGSQRTDVSVRGIHPDVTGREFIKTCTSGVCTFSLLSVLGFPHSAGAQIVQQTRETRARSIAYTFTEPTVFYEFMLDTARLAAQADCGRMTIHRSGFMVVENKVKNGACSYCGAPTPGIWE